MGTNRWCEEQNRLPARDRTAPERRQIYLEEGVALLDLARNAQRLFAKQPPREKRRLLNFVPSNCTWENGEVVAAFRQPFDMLAETTTAAARAEAGESAKLSKNEIWLGDLDSNQD
jgi:site-specific DNA recombinase